MVSLLSFFFSQTPLVNAQSVNIDLNTEYQTITGFGGMNLPAWIDDLNEDQADKAFGNNPGQLGLSLLRLRVPTDTNQFYREVPTALRAKSHGAIVFGTPWSPPPSLKSNNNIVGGHLLPESYGAFAKHLLKFVSFMKDSGASLHAISLQNEPDIKVSYESCDWTAKQFIDFLKEQGSGFDAVNLIVPESFQFRRPLTDSILNDTAAIKYVDIIGGHIYGGGLSDYPLARGKGKEVWMTEHYTESQHSANDWPLALDVATEISNCMKANFNAYVWWYIRRFYGFIDDAGNITKRGYIMSQFSKFIRPGSVRVGATVSSAPGIDATAFKTDTSLVIVVVNRNAADVSLTFSLQDGLADTLAMYTTSAAKDVRNDSIFIVTGDSISATVDASSITTFASFTGNAGKHANHSPVADAGSDQSVTDDDNDGEEIILLDGTRSYDSDGSITNYSWSVNGKQVSWKSAFELALGTGNHVVALTVTDNDGARHSDTTAITINSLYSGHVWLEAECSHVGSKWNTSNDATASEGKYVMVQAGTQSLTVASEDASDLLIFDFHISESGVYKLWGRTKTPSANDDSFWIRMDEGSWVNWNGIPAGSSWQWDDVHDQSGGPVVTYSLDTGSHKLAVCYREDGAGLDKLTLTNTGIIPSGFGGAAENCVVSAMADHISNINAGIRVVPNPLQSTAQVSWDLPFNTLVILDTDGRILVNKKFPVAIQAAHLTLGLKPGIYIVRLNNEKRTGVTKVVVE